MSEETKKQFLKDCVCCKDFNDKDIGGNNSLEAGDLGTHTNDNSFVSSETREFETPPSPSITELFKGKCVLVTGATGFLGKVLVEKLLRSCPGIQELLILIRPSKKGTAESRLEDYRQHHIFERLREEHPGALNKIRVLSGDVSLDNMGLASSQLRKVITDVSFVFHCAANVRFDQAASNLLYANLVAVQNVLDACKSCEQLQAIVHVSTAYSFCNHKIISEQVYPELVKPENMIDAAKWMTEEQLRLTCFHYLNGRPAIYPFSKAMAEILLVESNHDLPVIIVRPSIVTAAMNEPYPGWIDNYNGPSGFISICGKGIVRTLQLAHNVNADWVPVDIVANTLIVSAHYIAVKSKCLKSKGKLHSRGNVPIVNCTCPENNSITWMKAVDICLPLLSKYPSMQLYRKPGGTVTPSLFLYYSCKVFYHYLPALFVDAISCLIWRKPRMISIYCKIHSVMSHLEYYTTRPFTFYSPNMRKLVKQMEPEDRKVFPIDQSSLNWNEYVENYVLGVRRYFSRENDDTLPDARRRMMRVHCAWIIFKLSSMAGMFALLKLLHKRGALKTSLLTSFSVVAYISMILRRNGILT